MFWSPRSLVVVVVLVFTLGGCETATVAPPGAQQVHVDVTGLTIAFDPTTVRPGDVYLVVDVAPEAAPLAMVGGIGQALTDADVARLKQNGDAEGLKWESIDDFVREGPQDDPLGGKVRIRPPRRRRVAGYSALDHQRSRGHALIPSYPPAALSRGSCLVGCGRFGARHSAYQGSIAVEETGHRQVGTRQGSSEKIVLQPFADEGVRPAPVADDVLGRGRQEVGSRPAQVPEPDDRAALVGALPTARPCRTTRAASARGSPNHHPRRAAGTSEESVAEVVVGGLDDVGHEQDEVERPTESGDSIGAQTISAPWTSASISGD